MSRLCNRCDVLYSECRPLRGVVCPNASRVNVVDPQPAIGTLRRRAAGVQHHATGQGYLVPILAADILQDGAK